jgi:hypothetical protein
MNLYYLETSDIHGNTLVSVIKANTAEEAQAIHQRRLAAYPDSLRPSEIELIYDITEDRVFHSLIIA